MARKSKVKFNKDGFEKLRKDPKIYADLERRAKNIAAAAGGEDMGYKVTPLLAEDPRGAVSVMATGKARAHNQKHHSLLRALKAGKK